MRFEFTEAASTNVVATGPGSELGGDTVSQYAIVLGNPHATAFVVEGSPEQLHEFATKVTQFVEITKAVSQTAERSDTGDSQR